jgi:hypothetical protein
MRIVFYTWSVYLKRSVEVLYIFNDLFLFCPCCCSFTHSPHWRMQGRLSMLRTCALLVS